MLCMERNLKKSGVLSPGHQNQFEKKQDKRQTMHQKVENINRIFQSTCLQHFDLFPDMRFWNKRSEAQGKAQYHKDRERN